jgi:tetrahydromethanopterin S-methyltransferase subunit G
LQELGVDIPLIGWVSAWDAVVQAYPQSKYIEDKLRVLDEYLNKWSDASQSLSRSIPTAIQGLQTVQEGGEFSPDLQREISDSVIGMASLEETTNDCLNILSETATMVSEATSGLERASNAKYVGKYISPVADKVDDLYDYINSLRKSAQTFSNDLSKQQAKLTRVQEKAEDRENELFTLWSNRQGAETKVYGILFGGIGILILLVVIILIISFRRRRLATQSIAPVDSASVSDVALFDTASEDISSEQIHEGHVRTIPTPQKDSGIPSKPAEPDIQGQCTLTLKIIGEGATIPRPGIHYFKEGTTIHVNVKPSRGWQFVGWVGDVDDPYKKATSVTMNINEIITATFQKIH